VELELGPEELAAAREEIEDLIAGVRAGRFEVTPEPHRGLCWDCPARARLCSHPPHLTDRPRPGAEDSPAEDAVAPTLF
jgi:hypothetical protein